MQRRNGRVRRPRDDGERFNRLARRRFVQIGVKLAGGRRLDPPVPQTGKAKRLAAFQHHPERLPFPVHVPATRKNCPPESGTADA